MPSGLKEALGEDFWVAACQTGSAGEVAKYLKEQRVRSAGRHAGMLFVRTRQLNTPIRAVRQRVLRLSNELFDGGACGRLECFWRLLPAAFSFSGSACVSKLARPISLFRPHAFTNVTPSSVRPLDNRAISWLSGQLRLPELWLARTSLSRSLRTHTYVHQD